MDNDKEATDVIQILAQELTNREIEVAILKARLNRLQQQQKSGGEQAVTFGDVSNA